MPDVMTRAAAQWADSTPDREEALDWLVSLRTDAPHLFTPSTGAGASGSRAAVTVARPPRTAQEVFDDLAAGR